MCSRTQACRIIRSATLILCIFSIPDVCVLGQTAGQPADSWLRFSSQASASPTPKGKRIVIAASSVLDGKGRVLHDARIVIEGSKIVAVETKAGTKVRAKASPV